MMAWYGLYIGLVVAVALGAADGALEGRAPGWDRRRAGSDRHK
jgi:hypothetical protein